MTDMYLQNSLQGKILAKYKSRTSRCPYQLSTFEKIIKGNEKICV
jgi:hypothetical protein